MVMTKPSTPAMKKSRIAARLRELETTVERRQRMILEEIEKLRILVAEIQGLQQKLRNHKFK